MSAGKKSDQRIVFGTMTLGPPNTEELGSRITSMDDYKKILDHLQAHGHDELDTARVYVGGQQEGWTRQAGYKERGFLVASKWYPNNPGDHKPEKIREMVLKSNEELGAVPDWYYLHAADRTTPFIDTLREINELHKQGKFKYFAISNFTAAEVAEVCLTCHYNGWIKPTLYQGMYNAITRAPEAELVVTLRRFGLDWVVYNPLAGGLLSGKIKSGDGVPTEGRFSDKAKSGAMYRKRYFKDATFDALKVIEDAIAKHDGLTMVETALRWCVHHSQLKTRAKGGNDGIIIGASSVAQLESNLKDFEKGPLPDDVVEALDKAWAICRGTTVNYWHGDNEYKYDTLKAVYPPLEK